MHDCCKFNLVVKLPSPLAIPQTVNWCSYIQVVIVLSL